MATTAKPLYGASTAITITLASLASDTNLLAGRASTAVVNSTDLAIDSLVSGKITVGTTPTANTQIEVWLYGSQDGSTYSGGATGTDANLTPTGNAKSLLFYLTGIPITLTTSNLGYQWGPFSVAQAFGGTMPVKWGVYVVHNCVAALNSTGGNHVISYLPVQYQSV